MTSHHSTLRTMILGEGHCFFPSADLKKQHFRIAKLLNIASSCYFTTQRILALDSVVDSTGRVILMGDAARAPPVRVPIPK
jgi:hypothetical protein